MIQTIPNYVDFVFLATMALTIYFFIRSIPNQWVLPLVIILVWGGGQSLLAYCGFFLNTNTLPPKFVLVILPTILFFVFFFNSRKGKVWSDKLDVKSLTILHIIRIPIEIVLLWLFLSGVIPKIATFEGRNFDILVGLTAPIVFYFHFIKKTLSKRLFLVWNFVSLALLFSIVMIAILSLPFPFQQLAFDQPNIAVLYFPYVLLPAVVVPLVVFSHITIIRSLLKK